MMHYEMPMTQHNYGEQENEMIVRNDCEEEEEEEEEEDDDMEASDSSSSVAGVGSPTLLQKSAAANNWRAASESSAQTHEKRHVCEICGKAFSYFSILESHKRSHTGEKPFNCHFCDKKFAQKATLQVHERTHTGERPYKCRYCEKTFAQYGTKTVHEKSAHLGIRNYKCPKCDKLLSSPSALYTHKKTHGDKTFRCEFCPKTFALKNYLKLHVKQVHEQNERKHVCPYCHKGFAYAGSLQVHVRTHTGERPYTCRFCPKGFASQGNLQSHERTHTGERPYSCRFCQRTFIQKSQLTAHESTHKTNDDGLRGLTANASVIQNGDTSSRMTGSTLSNDESESDGENRFFTRLPNVYATTNVNLNLNNNINNHYQTSQMQFGVPTPVYNNADAPYTPVEVPSEYGPLSASKPPTFSTIGNSSSAFHALPASTKSAQQTTSYQQPMEASYTPSSNDTTSRDVLGNFIPPTSASSLPTSLLSTQLLLQQLQNPDQFNYLVHSNLLSLAAAAAAAATTIPPTPAPMESGVSNEMQPQAPQPQVISQFGSQPAQTSNILLPPSIV